MSRRLPTALLGALLIAGCVQLPPTPQDIQAKKFETVPDKAVIYVVRNDPDTSVVHGTMTLGDNIMITTFPGTYFRWEVPPGTHRIAGYAADSSEIVLKTEAGRLYFVQQSIVGTRSMASGFLQRIPERDGRAMVLRSELISGF